MAPLISTNDLEQHVETDLPPAALKRLIADADALIVEKCGPHAATTETFWTNRVDEYIYPSRRVASVDQIDELDGDTETTLANDDYEILDNGIMIRRLNDGTNPSSKWLDRVVVQYTPITQNERRIRVTIDLVRLAIQYNALKAESAGDYDATSVDYEDERMRLVRSLKPVFGFE